MPWSRHALFPQSKPTPAAGTCRRLSLVEAFAGAAVTLDTPIARLRRSNKNSGAHQGNTEVERRSNSAGRINAQLDGQIAWKRSP
jgi:hypothetical protein